MAGFKEIVGHEQIIEHLQNAIKLDKVSHAYIFNGESKAGKKLLASAFAMTLQCEKGQSEPCMECHSCKQSMSNNQPDIIWVTHEKPTSIGVDDIRDKVNNDIQIKPYSSPYKIYIIDEAEKMTTQAQNALLKTIEEPPVYGIIILLTNNADELLPTINSRCVTLNLRAVKPSEIKKYLMETLHVPDYQANISVAFAQGNVGKAIKLASADNFNNIKEEAIHLLKNIQDMEVYEVMEKIKGINELRFEINDYFDIIMIWYRDVLLFKATREVDNLIFKDELNSIKKQASKCSYDGIQNILDALEKAKQRLNANVNFELVIELLLLTIKESSR